MTDLRIADVQDCPVSFPIPPERRVALGIGLEVNEDFLAKHPAIEGPGYV